MLNQKTTLHLSQKVGNLKSNSVDIKSDIFQKFLSPLLFYLSLILLSTELDRTGHLFYMDDLKLFVKDDDNLEGQLQTVKNFISDIEIKFGLDKRAKATYERRLIKSTSVKLENKTTIKELKKEVYKYPTAIESIEIQHGTMREKIRNERY